MSQGQHGGDASRSLNWERLAATTVCFRDQFPLRKLGAPPGRSLLEAPAFVRGALGLRKLEVWNLQFEDESLAYADELRRAADRAGVEFVNVQLDLGYDLSHADPEEQARSEAFVREWMDRAVQLGSQRLRVNLGPLRPVAPFPRDRLVESLQRLAAYGRALGVTVLVENHFGYSLDPRNVVAVLEGVDDPYCRAQADWGNTPSDDSVGRLQDLALLNPWLDFVSAKAVDFDADYTHTSYDLAQIVEATEAAGYRGIYSVELWADTPPAEPVRAVAAVLELVNRHLR